MLVKAKKAWKEAAQKTSASCGHAHTVQAVRIDATLSQTTAITLHAALVKVQGALRRAAPGRRCPRACKTPHDTESFTRNEGVAEERIPPEYLLHVGHVGPAPTLQP